MTLDANGRKMYAKSPLVQSDLSPEHYTFLTQSVPLGVEDHQRRLRSRAEMRERGLYLPKNELLDASYYDDLPRDFAKQAQAAAAANYNARQEA